MAIAIAAKEHDEEAAPRPVALASGPGPLPDPVHDRLPIDGLRLLTASEVLVLAGFALAATGVHTVPWVLALVVLAITAAVLWTAWRAWGPSEGHPVRDSDVVLDVAIDLVSNHARIILGQAHLVRRHADAQQVIGLQHLQRFLFCKAHLDSLSIAQP